MPSPRPSLSAWCYSFAWIASLADQVLHVQVLGTAAGIAMLLFLLLEFPNQRRYAQVLLIALVAIGMVGIIPSRHPLALFDAGWRRGASYAVFFFAISTLRDAAQTSRLVHRCGRHLVTQPPGRRYAALTAGGHLFGIILSYGSIDLLGAMVMRANTLESAGGSAATQSLRTRRMMMAIYRGFAVMNCWNPINIMTVVVSSAVPAAPMRLLLPFAFLTSLGMVAIGWLEDRQSAARLATRTVTHWQNSDGWTIHLRVLAIVALVLVLAEAVSILSGLPLVGCVTLTVPIVAMGWVLVQSQRTILRRPAERLPRSAAVLHRRIMRFVRHAPNLRAEATVLAGSGFMGVALGSVLPAGGIAPFIAHVPAWLVPLLVPAVLIVTGQIGLNPIAMIALLGAAVPDPRALGVSPAALAFACMLGWGLGVNMTPMSSAAIITARWARVSPWTVATTWNLVFTLSSLVLAWVAIAALAAAWDR
ncbi:MAG TPA: hypothetical protein VGG99_15065 [Acetobacteraceae bacterium]